MRLNRKYLAGLGLPGSTEKSNIFHMEEVIFFPSLCGGSLGKCGVKCTSPTMGRRHTRTAYRCPIFVPRRLLRRRDAKRSSSNDAQLSPFDAELELKLNRLQKRPRSLLLKRLVCTLASCASSFLLLLFFALFCTLCALLSALQCLSYESHLDTSILSVKCNQPFHALRPY